MNLPCCLLFRSIVVYDSLWPHGMQHIRLPCSSQSPNEVHVHGISDAIQPSHPLMPPSPSALNLSQNQDFFNESAVCNRWPKYWSFSFSISPSTEYSRLISLKTDWFGLCAVQGTSPQFEGINSLAFWLLYSPAPTTVCDPGKTIALTIQIFVSRVISLLFNTLYRFVITFLLRSKCFLISWLQWPPAVISEPEKRNSVSTSTFSPSICHAVMGSDAMILVFFNILIFLYRIEKLIFFIYDL